VSKASELRIGTRGSPLALWQARTVAARLSEVSGEPCRIVPITTSGDRLSERPLSEIGGKGVFVKEIEDALRRHEIDLAVHSSKDMPAVQPEDLAIGAVLPREDPRDAVVLRVATPTGIDDVISHLGPSPAIGTGSVRRIAQLVHVFPGARFVPIRGNLDTRLRKLDAGEYDALILAAAGLRRLGFAARISYALSARECIPAPGQGIVAIQIRQADATVAALVAAIDDEAARQALAAEQAVVAALGGGCQTPIGALAVAAGGDDLDLIAVVAALDGSRHIQAGARGLRRDAAELGARVATDLVSQGAKEILAAAVHHD
jgi:hydroxymethylbilane synthase